MLKTKEQVKKEQSPTPPKSTADKIQTVHDGKDYQAPDTMSALRKSGTDIARKERTKSGGGFAGLDPCEAIIPTDFKELPYQIKVASASRNNLGEIVLGCRYKVVNSDLGPGEIAIYFSDSQAPHLAAEGVDALAAHPDGKKVTSWKLPASFNSKTGEFVWSRGKNFITLSVALGGTPEQKLELAKEIASKIHSRFK